MPPLILVAIEPQRRAGRLSQGCVREARDAAQQRGGKS